MTPHRLKMYSNPLLLIFLVLFFLTITGCFHSSSDGWDIPGMPSANPTGYYNVQGTATVGDGSGGTLVINDLQAMVNGNRFIAISDANGLVYDGTMTNINGNNFTAAVTVFQDGNETTTSTLTGMITEGARITGTLTGDGLGSGTIHELLYAVSNNEASDLSRVENNVNERWFDRVGGGTIDFGFAIGMTGSITGTITTTDGVFSECTVGSGTISPITGTSLYTLSLTLSSCNISSVNGDYSGLASIRTESTEIPTGDRLVLVVSNSNFSLQGEFKKDNLF